MPEPITLLREPSPAADVLATVEADGMTVYLYVQGPEDSEFGMRALWVANTAPAPDGPDVERMKRGEAPRLPKAACAHPGGMKLAQLEPFRFVWFEEGTGVALYGKPGLLAILPAGTPDKGPFTGFAAQCTQKTQLAWPLSSPEAAYAQRRVAGAEAFWRGWAESGAWPRLQEGLLASIDAALGKSGRYFATDEGEWPPRFIAVREREGVTVLVTGGTSIRPQPGVASPFQPAEGPRRIELAMALADSGLVEPAGAYLSGQSQLPWAKTTWLGAGHTLGCDALPKGASGTEFTAVVFAEDPPGAPQIAFPDYEGDPVHVLWALPITAAERALARAKGSRALLDLLFARKDAWIHRDRPPAA